MRCAALLLAVLGTGLVARAQGLAMPDIWTNDVEPNSPAESSPALSEPGLTMRGLPSPGPAPEPGQYDVESFYWATHPFENEALMHNTQGPGSDETFRTVTTYFSPLALRPKVYRKGNVEFYPWAGVSQSFDSNIQLTPDHPISDFYLTPRFGAELQIGTPDSTYSESYDTVTAEHLLYEGYADIFYQHHQFTAYNSQLDFTSRIGRSQLVIRPYLNFSDITGDNLQLLQLQNRAERIVTEGGVTGEYAITPITSVKQVYSALDFEHGDNTNINYMQWSTRQEVSYLLPNNTARALIWAGAETTKPSRPGIEGAGNSGNEFSGGVGWEGFFTTRTYSELRIGWGQVNMAGHVPGRWNMSGPRWGGYTTFDWNPRVRLAFIYERQYVYNETAANDNYVVNLTQVKAEFFLGDNWLVIPYIGTGVESFQLTHRTAFELRPELEVAYVFSRETYQIIGNQDKSLASRVFIKLGFDYSTDIKPGTGQSGGNVKEMRVSTGLNWNF